MGEKGVIIRKNQKKKDEEKVEMKMDYAEAVRLACAGEEQGFSYLYENTYKTKYYLALQYMKNQDAAEDVLQEAYMKAFTKLNTLQDPENFPAWLGQIVANTAKNALVKRNPVLFTDVAEQMDMEDYTEQIEDEDIESQPELSYTREETKELVHELIDSLSEEQRMCILLFHIEDMPIKDIAQTLGCSENTVKSRLNYGRKNLKVKAEELQKKGYKLYSIAPLPLLLLLLRTDEKNMLADGSIQKCGRKIAKDVFSQMSDGGSVSENGDTKKTGKSHTKGKTAGKTAGKTGFLATTAGKVTVAVISLCVAGGAIFGITQIAGKNHEEDKKPAVEENKKTSEENKKEEVKDPITLSDDDYPKLIEGNLTKEEMEYVLAYGPEDSEDVNQSDLAECYTRLNSMCEGDQAGNYMRLAGTDANYRIGHNLEDVNRYFSSFTDFQFSEENDSDTETGADVRDGVIWMSQATLNYEATTTITDASYLDDTMWIHYTFVIESYENGNSTTNKIATLKRDENGKFRISAIEDDTSVTPQTDTASTNNSDSAQSTDAEPVSTRSLYEGVLQSIQNQEPGYEFSYGGGDYEYFLCDLNGDGTKELVVGSIFTEDVFNAYDVRVFTINHGSSGDEVKALNGDVTSIAISIPADGNGLYSNDGMSRGTGETSIYRITMDGDNLTKGSSPEITYIMGDSTESAFMSSNPAAQWRSISDLSGLDE